MVERRGALRWAMSPPYGNSLIAAGTSASKEARVCAEAGMHTLADPGRLGSFVPGSTVSRTSAASSARLRNDVSCRLSER
jgi:hypothetical protein